MSMIRALPALFGVLFFSAAVAAAPLGTLTEGFTVDGEFVEGDLSAATPSYQTTDGQVFGNEADALAHQEGLNIYQEVTEFLKDLGYVSSLDPARAAIVDHKDTVEFIYGGGDYEPAAE